MGAAAMGRTDVQMIVFIAIMLHKVSHWSSLGANIIVA